MTVASDCKLSCTSWRFPNDDGPCSCGARRPVDVDAMCEANVRAIIEERDRFKTALILLRDLCGGIMGADDEDRVSEIRVYFADRKPMYLRNAVEMACAEATALIGDGE